STDFSGVKYTSPFFLGQTKSSGFQFLTSWGMDDAFAAGLRYAEDFGAYRFAAGVAYSNWSNPDMLQCSNASLSTSGGNALVALGTTGPTATAAGSTVNCDAIIASASLMHVPSGLYVSGGWGQLNDNNRHRLADLTTPGLGALIGDTDSSWWIQA